MNTIQIKVATTDTDFIGIYSQNNHMTITFPIGYNIVETTITNQDTKKINSLYKEVSQLLTLLEQNQDTDHFDEGSSHFNFSAALFLIKDYFANGLYKEPTIITNQQQTGAINWNQTIKNKTPIYNLGNFIYTTTINQSTNLEQSDITAIQTYCLNKAFSILKIFYNNYQVSTQNNLSKEAMIYKLEKKLSTTNIDSKRKLLHMMKKFIQGTSLNNITDKEIKIGRTHFNKIWEKILKKELTKQLPPLEILPKAYYLINNQKQNTSSLIPDIIVEDKTNIYIIDAKYYKVNTLPQTSDILKQLFYASYISQYKQKIIKNLFLLPNNISTPDKIKFLGIATTDTFQHQNGGKIETYYLDTKTIISTPQTILNQILKN